MQSPAQSHSFSLCHLYLVSPCRSPALPQRYRTAKNGKKSSSDMDWALLTCSKLPPNPFPLPAPPFQQHEFTSHDQWPGTSIDCDI